MQLSVLTCVNFLCVLTWGQGGLSSVLLVINLCIFCYQAWWIFPYTWFASSEVDLVESNSTSTTISFLTSNVYMHNKSTAKLLALIHQYQPDIIVTLESDIKWQQALSVLAEEYPYRVEQPLDNLYGMHVYSKYKLIDTEVLELVQEGIPSVHCKVRVSEQHVIKCHFLHPAPPSPTENEASTARDIELIQIANLVQKSELPTVVTGDLNDVAWSKTTREFRKVSGLLDPRVGRGCFNTFHASYPLCRWPLDHIFHSQEFSLIAIERLPSIDSDHFPLFCKFSINR
ncbi:endonuclease/exonuclease/phosphatase family protein [Paraglaciecola aquimarina]|uniref:Endonuclease/exonuclease/phosphatase family protein n=1 Tax=Paraglaciecola algarum TaxID=3050085 RepID=A0ABS9D858_9ALTE|nr:endonuclease/exonuclease/phosphatase family protein [Paraglaciecola sp. G1-23]MCF2947846.1 endonuclease/exonuclease/phosphatase family protein [Paraglaciecola sp. G1-23]